MKYVRLEFAIVNTVTAAFVGVTGSITFGEPAAGRGGRGGGISIDGFAELSQRVRMLIIQPPDLHFGRHQCSEHGIRPVHNGPPPPPAIPNCASTWSCRAGGKDSRRSTINFPRMEIFA